jgi:molybdopterin/thiamine biosynthesis adenylyltransferase
MSQRPIGRSADLQRLRADGYTIALLGGLLVVSDIPYVDATGTVHDDGSLVMPLTLSGDTAQAPSDHTAHFVGGIPCDRDGVPLAKIINNTNSQQLADGLIASCYFSAKPHGTGRYKDFHEKVTTYIAHISSPAQALASDVTSQRHRPVPAEPDDGPFAYTDTASSRAGIDAINDRVRDECIGIVGLGGTGVYILDLVAKTRVAQIHPFDSDHFLTHNAFRAPGAPTLTELEELPFKVEHFTAIYSNMHRGITAHPYDIDATNVDELSELSFVFICIDENEAKKPIFAALEEYGIPFIDVGMGIDEVAGKLTGIIRTTTSTPAQRDHIEVRVPAGTVIDNEYRTNIQIAELNALNAALAVIRWKKERGIYADLEDEHHSLYAINGNHLTNLDQP